jgi:hypothetical protein
MRKGELGNKATSNLTLDKEIRIEHLACRDIANDGENTDDSYTQ